ncbi:dTDP-glucose 46-dehydratase [Geitlerinema sp. FC II]|nr:dTDP-glucose 46-dehydratase [Geitlerinema sp. FC II]
MCIRDSVHGDVRNPEDLAPEVLKPTLILECSAEPSVLALSLIHI